MKAQEKAIPVISPITLSKCHSSQYGTIWVYPSERFGSSYGNSLCSSLLPWRGVPCSLLHTPYSYCTYPRRFCCFQSSDAASHSPYHRLISLPPSSHHHLELSYSDRLNYTWELLEAFLGSLQRVPDEVCKDIVVILASSKGPPIWVDSLQLWLQVGCVTKSKRSAGMCVWYFTIILPHLCLALP